MQKLVLYKRDFIKPIEKKKEKKKEMKKRRKKREKIKVWKILSNVGWFLYRLAGAFQFFFFFFFNFCVVVEVVIIHP
jgi:hypothetical protein